MQSRFPTGPVSATTWNALPATLEGVDHPVVTASLKRKKDAPALSGTYALVEEDSIEFNIREHEVADYISDIWWSSNSLPSNQPTEDRHSTHTISSAETDALVEAAGSGGPERFWKAWHGGDVVCKTPRWLMSSVIDGFSGPVVADTINRVLHASLAFALGCAKPRRHEEVTKVIERVYEDIDHALISAPQGFIKPDPTSRYILPPGAEALLFAAGLLHPQSGAMATTTLVDLVHREVYVANLGDCRAVAGFVDEAGSWTCLPFSEDHTIKNGKEISAGLIKGMAGQTRHFGKAHLKAPRDGLAGAMEALGQPLAAEFSNQNLDGVPYILSTPEVRSVPMKGGDRHLRFVILATDGLWDRLTSEEAVLLVAKHLSGHKGEISKIDLAAPAPIPLRVAAENDRPFPAQALPGTAGRDSGQWTFGDENPATHLIRNAIGDGDAMVRRMVLSLGPPMGRAMRDDMTVTVLLFDSPVA